MARFAVVGHVEWVDFLTVPRVPLAGEIVHADKWWSEAAGGGAVAAVQLAKLGGTATFFTALGNDDHARRAAEELRAHGVEVEAVVRDRPQRRAVALLDARGERTIVVQGERLVPKGEDDLPWDRLAEMDGVYFTGGDTGSLRAARAARTLVATPRAHDAFAGSDVTLDALVRSASDAGEQDGLVGQPDRRDARPGRWDLHDGRRPHRLVPRLRRSPAPSWMPTARATPSRPG